MTSLKITKALSITARNMFVLAGNLILGNIKSGMFLINQENDTGIKINSVESINSNDSNELIALTFFNLREYELEFLKRLEMGSIALLRNK